MKKMIYSILIALWLVIGGACAKSPVEPGDGMINPGDRIGDFLITTGDGDEIIYMTLEHCPFDKQTNTESCEQPVGKKVNVGQGIFDDNPASGKTLDEYWSEQTHTMIIEGRPVNLQAFGFVEVNNPVVGTVRVWNVVVSTNKPGKIAAHSTGVVGGDPFDYTGLITFTAP